MRTTREIAAAVRDMSELVLLTNQPFMVVCMGSREIDIYRVRDVMSTKGWNLNALQKPASIHFCVTLNLVGHSKRFITDLRDSVELISKEGHGGVGRSGTAGIYGSIGSMPSGPISCILGAYTDEALSP